MKQKRLFFSTLVATVLLMIQPAMAKELSLFGEPLSVAGYISNELVFSPNARDHYDTVKGMQSNLMNLFVEGKYSPQEGLFRPGNLANRFK